MLWRSQSLFSNFALFTFHAHRTLEGNHWRHHYLLQRCLKDEIQQHGVAVGLWAWLEWVHTEVHLLMIVRLLWDEGPLELVIGYTGCIQRHGDIVIGTR